MHMLQAKQKKKKNTRKKASYVTTQINLIISQTKRLHIYIRSWDFTLRKTISFKYFQARKSLWHQNSKW